MARRKSISRRLALQAFGTSSAAAFLKQKATAAYNQASRCVSANASIALGAKCMVLWCNLGHNMAA